MRMMSALGGSFWSTFRNFQSHSALDELLEKEDATLSEVLNEEETIQELKSHNQKLIEFLNEERLAQLIEYITVFPPENSPKERENKYPFISCELLSCDVPPVLDKLFDSEPLLQQLFSFLHNDYIHPTLAGYFGKVALTLANRHIREIMKFVTENNFIGELLKHLEYKSVADVIFKLLLVDIPGEPVYLPQRIEIVKGLLKGLKDEKREIQHHAGHILTDLINKVTETNSWRSLVEVIMNKETLEYLFSGLVEANLGVVNACVSVLKSIMSSQYRDELFTLDQKDKDSLENEMVTIQESEQTCTFIDCFVQSLDGFIQILVKESDVKFLTTFNEKIEVLGEGRLKIVEALNAAIKMEKKEIYTKLYESGAMKVLVDLFFRFSWNSMLHSSFENIVQGVLYINHSDLKTQLLEDAKLVEKIAQKGLEQVNSYSKLKPGYLGHLKRIANLINKLAQAQPEVHAVLLKSENWESFKTQYLEVENKKEEATLGDQRLPTFGDNFSEDEEKEQEQEHEHENKEHIFSSYQSSDKNEYEEAETPEEEIEQSEPLSKEDLEYEPEDKEKEVKNEENQEIDVEIPQPAKEEFEFEFKDEKQEEIADNYKEDYGFEIKESEENPEENPEDVPTDAPMTKEELEFEIKEEQPTVEPESIQEEVTEVQPEEIKEEVETTEESKEEVEITEEPKEEVEITEEPKEEVEKTEEPKEEIQNEESHIDEIIEIEKNDEESKAEETETTAENTNIPDTEPTAEEAKDEGEQETGLSQTVQIVSVQWDETNESEETGLTQTAEIVSVEFVETKENIASETVETAVEEIQTQPEDQSGQTQTVEIVSVEFDTVIEIPEAAQPSIEEVKTEAKEEENLTQTTEIASVEFQVVQETSEPTFEAQNSQPESEETKESAAEEVIETSETQKVPQESQTDSQEKETPVSEEVVQQIPDIQEPQPESEAKETVETEEIKQDIPQQTEAQAEVVEATQESPSEEQSIKVSEEAKIEDSKSIELQNEEEAKEVESEIGQEPQDEVLEQPISQEQGENTEIPKAAAEEPSEQVNESEQEPQEVSDASC
ncbi:unnamed protein product [Blepharisma stoltei]|uniref:Uncharacterized protein n=1 Tax=Blepharisma stoltei TaxID=1481888 RepID=A0AAU9JNX5_9CILI|nr:unnamed protein product [Blepharisma stoltei]